MLDTLTSICTYSFLTIQYITVCVFFFRRTGSGRSHDLSHDPTSPMMSSQVERGLALLHSVRLVSETRQRAKFIPFLLRNSTGLRLEFATLTSVPSQVRVWGCEGVRE